MAHYKKGKPSKTTKGSAGGGKEKARLHARNKNRDRYNFEKLIAACPALGKYVTENKYGDDSIDFANAAAVKELNRAILIHHYGLEYWDIPEGYLCPPIPGRADYIHHIADLLCKNNYGKIPTGPNVHCLDIGTGSNCIYPIIGNNEYGWSFVGTDIDEDSLASARNIVSRNPSLSAHVECRFQDRPFHVLEGIIEENESYDLMVCNPPFHGSAEEAAYGSMRKVSNLKHKRVKEAELNFGGQNNELWCEGGEVRFISTLIRQSRKFQKQCYWFSTLVSKSAHLDEIYRTLDRAEAVKVETIPMGQGNKTSRIVAWTFLSTEEQKQWRDTKWNKKTKKEE